MIEALLVYDLHDDGSAHPADLVIRARAAAQGCGCRPTACARLFLKTGTVNREALDLDALDEKPVTYAGGNGIVLDLAYHPVLPLAACVGADFSIVCDRETGKLQADALKSAAADLQSARFQHVWFSADGKGLLFDMIAAGGEHLLYRAALNLSPADVNKVGNRLANMASLGHELLAEQLPAAGKGSVPLAEIDAFRGDRGREMSPAEIGRALTDAVVIVQNERLRQGSSSASRATSSPAPTACGRPRRTPFPTAPAKAARRR